MSSSTGSSEARASWITLNQRLLQSLKEIHPVDETVPSEAAFRDKFWEFSPEFNSPSVDRNYGIFNRRHGQILFFTRVLDQALELESPDSLSDVFWTHALAALQAAIRHGYQFKDLVGIYSSLNSAEDIPVVSSDLPQFPRSLRVQEPLQEIFETYIECYYVFVRQYANANEDDRVDEQPILDIIASAGSTYRDAEYHWRNRLREAMSEKREEIVDEHSGETTLVADRDIRFELIRNLGKGAYGTVDEVRETSTGGVYARKSIPTRIMGQESESIEKRVKNEVEIMSKLRHNHIASVNIFFRETKFWSMIMLPVADCDLRVFLDEKCVAADFPREAMRMIDPWFGCLISALAYAHAEKIKHEDIKPNNILIKGNKVYLTDFGTAMDFSQLERSTVSDFYEQGTPIYWAPEPRAWGRPADVFALGCVFSEMLTVRQHRSLTEYRNFRYTQSREFGYAYRSNLPMVRQWLKKELHGIDRNDPAGQMVLEQTLNMLIEDPVERSEALRLKKQLKSEDVLFCATCV